MHLRLALMLLALLGLTVAGTGCESCQSQGGESETGETSGGEDGDGEDGGGDDGDLEAPPGSQDPDDDDEDTPDGDLEQEANQSQGQTGQTGQGQTGQTGGQTGQTGQTPPQPQGSPWGQPEGESGRPLPPRRPMNATARSHYSRGVQLAQSGDSRGATEAFQAALSADSSAFMAAYNLGVMADRLGQEGRAIQFYQQALRIQADYERAVEGIARIHVRRGNASEAVSFVTPIANQWERNLHLQAILGDVLVHANRPEEAIAAARRALRRDERFVPAMTVLVKANVRLGRTELAESILDQAIETSANHAELHFLRARLYQERGQLGPALEGYRRAIELEPGYTEARMQLGLAQLAAGNYQDALTQFQTASQLAPTLPGVRLALGDALRATRQWQQAKAEFDRVIEMDAQNAQVHFNLGLLYLEAGAEFPGMQLLDSLNRSVEEFNRYRSMMGPRLPRDDQAQAYLEELGRLIEREQRRIERDAARAQRDAERAARAAQEQQAAPAEGQTPPAQ
jgi:tetratricopeptide (TPR) repeat protein